MHPNCCTPEQLEVIFAEGQAGTAAAADGDASKPKKPAFFSMHSYAKIQVSLTLTLTIAQTRTPILTLAITR